MCCFSYAQTTWAKENSVFDIINIRLHKNGYIVIILIEYKTIKNNSYKLLPFIISLIRMRQNVKISQIKILHHYFIVRFKRLQKTTKKSKYVFIILKVKIFIIILILTFFSKMLPWQQYEFSITIFPIFGQLLDYRHKLKIYE